MTTTALSEALAKLRQIKVPNWPAGRILGDIADAIESALASAEPVAWELTCHGTVQQIVRREDVAAERLAYWRTFDPDASCRELVYTHAQPAAKVEAPGRDAGPSFDDVCRTIRAYGLACIDLGMEGMRPSSPTPASVPDGWTIKPYFDGYKVTPPGGHECTVLIEGEEDSHSSSIEDVTLHTLCAALLATNQEGTAP